MKYTHTDLVNLGSEWLRDHYENVIVPNCSTILRETKTATTEIPDVIGWCSWTSVLIECKTTMSDFLFDAKKSFRFAPANGVGELRYYLCQDNLIKDHDLPEYWGLLSVNDEGEIKVVKQAIKQESNLPAERTMLVSYIRRNP